MEMAIIRLPVIMKRTKGITRKIMMTMKRKTTIVVPIRGMKKRGTTMTAAVAGGIGTNMKPTTGDGIRTGDGNPVEAGVLLPWTATR